MQGIPVKAASYAGYTSQEVKILKSFTTKAPATPHDKII